MSNNNSDNLENLDTLENLETFRVIIDNVLALLTSSTTWHSISQSDIITSYSYFLIQATDICRKYHGVSILDIIKMDDVKSLWEELRDNHSHLINFWELITQVLAEDKKAITLSKLEKPFDFSEEQKTKLISGYQELKTHLPKLYLSPILFDVVFIMGIQNVSNFIAPFFNNDHTSEKINQVINQIIFHCHQSKNEKGNLLDFLEHVRKTLLSVSCKISIHSDSQEGDIISSQELLTSSHDSIKNIENLDVERIKKDKFYNQKTNQSFNNVFRQFRLTSNSSLNSFSGSSDSDIYRGQKHSPKTSHNEKDMPTQKLTQNVKQKENPSILTDYSEDDRVEASPIPTIQSNMPSFTDLQDDLTILQNDSNASSEELNKLTHHLIQESHTHHECKSRIPSTEFDFSDAMSVLNNNDLLNILLQDKK